MNPENHNTYIGIDKSFLKECAFQSYCYQRDNAPDIDYKRWSVIYPSYNIFNFEIIYKFKPSLN